MRLAMAIDTKKCIGCGDCVIACQSENRIPEGYCRSWISESVTGSYPDVQAVLQSERCNHCDNAPCVRCCPTDSSYVQEDGTVMVDPKKCIGCGACIESCPYDARMFHPDGYADKCTFCDHLVAQGSNPACVGVCPTNCMFFGDIDDPESDLSKLLRSRKWNTLIPEAGTKPQVYYLS